MQLSSLFANPRAELTRPAAAPAAVAAATETGAGAATMATQPVEDAGFAAKLLGRVGESQNGFLANQQMLGQVTSMLGARLTQVTSNVMRLLTGGPSSQSIDG